ncbi:MAG: hypothetical protein C0407_14530, partial [Desulfobacca sp.]|nr:hypothetical protein [Desulfobacca sp.]
LMVQILFVYWFIFKTKIDFEAQCSHGPIFMFLGVTPQKAGQDGLKENSMTSRAHINVRKPFPRVKKNSGFLKKGSLIALTSCLIMTSLLLPVKSNGKEKTVNPVPKFIAFPLGDFADGKAKHFQYKTPGGKTVRYFIVRSSDGVIRAAFDACDVCWPSGKGYYQEGDFMICRNCGKKFPTPKINVITGGCNPAALTRQITKTQVIIQTKDILEGERYFNF